METLPIAALVQEWSVTLVTIFSVFVTAASILLRSIASYIKFKKEYLATYEPSVALISFMAILSAVSQNSATAASIVSAKKGKDG
jgi:hypothetical protein